ncbi:MAG: glycosyltransferase [Planctomycetes bacterium]|jgi:GT2 family glycosyltransferase|nr:glycosyltransferase [Planctomycetota bacterium]
MSQPAVSIVVVTSDRLVDLRRCLGELRRHLAAPGLPTTEVLTVHAPHDTASMAMVRAEYPEVAVHVAPRRHLSEQRNLGARRARGEILIYLDDDAWPRAGWLAALLQPFAEPRVLAASGPVFRGDGSLQCERLAASPIGRLIPLAADRPLPAGMAPSFSGCNLALRRTALFAIGGFDENLPYQPDDMDVCGRLFRFANRSAAALHYCPAAKVTHESSPGPYRRTLQDRAWFVVARDNMYFACRHAGPVRGLLGGVVLQVPKLWRFGAWLLQGKLGPLPFVRCVGKHVGGMLAGCWKGLTARARLPLQPLPTAEPGSIAGATATAVEEAAPCRTPQPI